MNWLIIAAGGNGERIKLDYNKIFFKILNKPLIYWTLSVFEKSKLIDSIILTTKEKEILKLKRLVNKYHFKKVIDIIPAEKNRQESTFKVLRLYKEKINKNDFVGIHNAVNPFVFYKEIDKVYEGAKKYGASLLAQPAKDTIKISNNNNFVDYSPQRIQCWNAQTPQVARFSLLWKAFVKANKEKFLGTDDTQLLERIGVKSKIIPCSHFNFKITYMDDLFLVRDLIKFFLKENV